MIRLARCLAAAAAVTTVLALAPAALAATVTWTGATSTDWSTSTNWSGLPVSETSPGASDDVQIPFNASISLGVTGNVKSMTITGSSFGTGGTISGSGALVLGSGGFTNDSGTTYSIDLSAITDNGPMTMSNSGINQSGLNAEGVASGGEVILNGTTSLTQSSLGIGSPGFNKPMTLFNSGAATLTRAGMADLCNCSTFKNLSTGSVATMTMSTFSSQLRFATIDNSGLLETVHALLDTTPIDNLAGGHVDVGTGTVFELDTTTAINQGTLTLDGGTLTGGGQIQGNVKNVAGTVSPGGDGTVGTLTINSSAGIGYEQDGGGTLRIDLRGTTQFDRLNISTGSATPANIGGTLYLDSTGYSPPANTDHVSATFQAGLMTGTFAGTFSSLSGPAASLYTVIYSTKGELILRSGAGGAGAPTATITTPAANATYSKGQVVDASFTCTAGSGGTLKAGTAGCAGTVANGGPVDTSTTGQHTFTVTATDTDSQTTTVHADYTVTSGGTGGAVPAVTSNPHASGAAKAGGTLTCSPGSWSNAPTGFLYQWSADGTPIAGASSSSYKVQSGDEGLTVTCTVTASNGAGASRPATSNGVPIPVPVVPHCPAVSGSVSGTMLGALRLGMTRAQARHAYSKSATRGRASVIFYCLTPQGIRAGFASSKLLHSLPASKRGKFAGRAIWISTASRFFAVHGVRVGATVAAAGVRLKLSGPFHVGKNDWYLAPAGPAIAVFKVRHGLIEELGIGDKRLTGSHAADRAFLTSFT